MLHIDFFRQRNRTFLTSSQCDRTFEWVPIGSSLHLSRYRFVTVVRQFGGNSKPRFVECLGVNSRTDSRVGKRYGTTGLYANLTEDAHALISGTRVPIGKACIRIAGLGAKHFYGEFVLLRNLLGDIKLKLTEGSKHLLTVGYLMTIQPHVGAIADTIEGENGMFAFLQSGQVERRAVPTAFGLYAVGCQHPHQGGGNGCWYPVVGIRQSDLPTLI